MAENDPLDTVELCDACGTVLDGGAEFCAVVPDSSALHAFDPALDGRRVLTACGIHHLAELVDQYRRRPYVPEEQWAGQICRVLEVAGRELTLDELETACGLSEEEIDRAVAWQNECATRVEERLWAEQYGEPEPPPDA